MERRAAFAEAQASAELCAERVHRRLPPGARARVALEDLRQEALLALWEALARWDAARGPLWPFACQRVRGAILDHCRAACPPGHVSLEAARGLAAAERDPGLALDTKRALERKTPAEVAAEMGLGVTGYLTVLQVAEVRGISPRAVRLQLQRGAIRGVLRGREWRVPAWAAAV